MPNEFILKEIMELKLCNNCNTEKFLSEFYQNQKGKNGVDWLCKECRKKSGELYRKRRKEGIVKKRISIPKGFQWCCTCKLQLPEDSFSSEFEYCCKECKYFQHIKRKYKITREEYNELAVRNNGMCAICLSRPFKYVDHDHTTGKARGLLCPPCNTAIGYFQEKPEIFNNALKYLGY